MRTHCARYTTMSTTILPIHFAAFASPILRRMAAVWLSTFVPSSLYLASLIELPAKCKFGITSTATNTNMHTHTLTSAASCWYCMCRGSDAPVLMAAKRRILTSGEAAGQSGCRRFWSPRTSFIGVVAVWHAAYAFEWSILTNFNAIRNATIQHRTAQNKRNVNYCVCGMQVSDWKNNSLDQSIAQQQKTAFWGAVKNVSNHVKISQFVINYVKTAWHVFKVVHRLRHHHPNR